ncbi:hypothetical protein GCM10008905_07410 [Clostridium malenominatum]|uniref:4Fe-4S ferredoxin-type domain-containing protein n=1 Tax=Clostridium malenominatum TaxID=1539 RepID=A0ABN1IQK5_9CLOT
MDNRTNYMLPEMPISNPIIYNKDKCIGCNRCVDICQVDILIPNPERGKSPIVAYPGECWYCGCCVMECPIEGAIKLRHPLMNEVHWIEKDQLIKKQNY